MYTDYIAATIAEKLLEKDSNIVLPIVAIAHNAGLGPVVSKLTELELADNIVSGIASERPHMAARCQEFTSFYIVDGFDPDTFDRIQRDFNPNYIVIVANGSITFMQKRVPLSHYTFPPHTIRKKFLYLLESNLVYCVVNKCGSTYIGKCLSNRDTMDAINARTLAVSHLPEIMSRTSDLYKFTVVRNPYTRMASTYNDIIAGNTDTPTPRNCLYRHSLKLPIDRRISFAEMLTAIEEQGFVWGPGHEHWLPQAVIAGYGIINYNAIGKLEDLHSFLTANIEPILRRTVPTKEVIFPGQPDRYSGSEKIFASLYDSNTKSRVYDLYKIDFDSFDYRAALPNV